MSDLDTANGHDTTGGLATPAARPACSREGEGRAATDAPSIVPRHPSPTPGEGRTAATDAPSIVPLHPSPGAGEGRTVKDPTAALRQRRARARRRDTDSDARAPQLGNRQSEKSNDFKGRVTVGRGNSVTIKKARKSKSVTASVQPRWQISDAAAYAAAVGLAAVAAYFSIRGMVVLFPGAPWAIIAMTVAMESAKLVTAGWLARRWRATAWIWRLALMAFVLGLALVNAGGTYSQLVSAHVGERGAAVARLETQAADLDARIEVAAHKVADLDARESD